MSGSQIPQKLSMYIPILSQIFGPNFGANVHEAVIKAGEKETGMTIHYVDEGVDTGEIILQKKCQVEPSDTPEILKTKVQELEKKWYPEVIRQIAAQQNSLTLPPLPMILDRAAGGYQETICC